MCVHNKYIVAENNEIENIYDDDYYDELYGLEDEDDDEDWFPEDNLLKIIKWIGIVICVCTVIKYIYNVIELFANKEDNNT